MKHTVLVWSLLLAGSFGVVALAPSVGSQAWARKSWSYRHYRRISRSIYKRYQSARRQRYRRPCHAHTALKKYQDWLKALHTQIPSLALRRHHQRYLKGRIRRFQRYARHWIRRTRRRCRRHWKRELKRQNNRLNAKCRALYAPGLKEDAAALWIGVTPWAHVYLNGKLCGTAPMFARLRPGRYTVRLLYPTSQDEHNTTVQLKAKAKNPTLIARQMKTPPPAPRRLKNLLAPSQLKWVLQRYQRSLRSCSIYAPQIGKVALSWQVSSKGRARQVKWERPAQAPQRFQRCIIRALKRIPFPANKGIARIHSYDITLRETPDADEP